MQLSNEQINAIQNAIDCIDATLRTRPSGSFYNDNLIASKQTLQHLIPRTYPHQGAVCVYGQTGFDFIGFYCGNHGFSPSINDIWSTKESSLPRDVAMFHPKFWMLYSEYIAKPSVKKRPTTRN